MRASLSAACRLAIPGLTALMLAPRLQACATCFGRSDSALAEGMNMGILFLLGVILSVLAAFASFIIYLARRSAALAARPAPRGTAARAPQSI